MAEVISNLDFSTIVKSPTRLIDPPLECEPYIPTPLLFEKVILYIKPLSPSHNIAPPSSPAMLNLKVELYNLQSSPPT